MKDMLRMYVIDNQSQWERYLPLVEFSYNKITTTQSRCLLIKLYMGGHVGHHYFGKSWKLE